MKFIEKTFDIPELKGISKKSIDVHLELYSQYVKNANLLLEKIDELRKEDPLKNLILVSELQRRFSFEFDGVRNHEYYFEQFEGGPKGISDDGVLSVKIKDAWGSVYEWLTRFKEIAMTRGPGWAVLYFDKKTDSLQHSWIEEQHIGHLAGVEIILALDVWEHSYLIDYMPSEKKKYIEAFFENINFEVIEKRFTTAQ